MRVVHIGTQVQSVFGIVDSDGNVVEQVVAAPDEGKPLRRFAESEFVRAFAEVAEAKAQLEQKHKERR